jgi:hypothetical protein
MQGGSSSGLAAVLDTMLDKGLVINIYVSVSWSGLNSSGSTPG